MKVGDKVTIRQWDDMAAEYGLDSDGDINADPFLLFLRGMERYCGTTQTVRVFVDGDIFQVDDSDSCFCAEMTEEGKNRGEDEQ
jgi:hypothetical protein